MADGGMLRSIAGNPGYDVLWMADSAYGRNPFYRPTSTTPT
jgi:hypothetical protein